MKIAASVTPNKTKFGPLLFAGDLEQGFMSLKELGYDGIELSLRTSNDIDSELLFKMLEKHDLELISVATGQSFIEDNFSLFSSATAHRVGAVERLKSHIDLASKSSANVILGGVKGSLDNTGNLAQYEKGMEAVTELVEYAEKMGVILLLESINRYEANIFNTVEESLKVAEKINSKALRILPDTFHMNIEEISFTEALEEAREYIGALHCADSNRLAPGMGHIDFSSIIQTAKKLPDIRYLGVEVLPLPDSYACAKTAISTIRQYL